MEAEAVALEASIAEGGCDRAAPLIYREEFPLGALETAMTPPRLAPGFYGFRLVARNASCQALAAGCVGIDVDASTSRVLVQLTSTAPFPGCDADVCVAGLCGGGGLDGGTGCPIGFDDCNGDEADGCEADLSMDGNCGACGVTCSGVPNATVFCSAGTCAIDDCGTGLGDCNGNYPDGCEAPLNTPTNCGACAAGCTPANAVSSCDTGACLVSSCNAGFDSCDGSDTTGCETSLSSLSDCGACGAACSLANATETCATGSCAIESCGMGFEDCDAMTANGCEGDLAATTDCGSCGNACGAGETCVEAVCCAAGCECDQSCTNGNPCLCDGGCQCVFDATRNGVDGTCSGAGTLCRIDAVSGNDAGDLLCDTGATCFIDVSTSSNAESTTCDGAGTRCEIDCTGVSNCAVSCTNGAACVVDCTSSSNCPGPSGMWAACSGAAMSCPGNVETCDAACP